MSGFGYNKTKAGSSTEQKSQPGAKNPAESAVEEEASPQTGLKRGSEVSMEEPPRKICAASGTDRTEVVNVYTALHRAAEDGRLGEVRELLRAGASTRAQNGLGDTPLHTAMDRGEEAAAEVLAEADAENDVADDDGLTPLHFAAHSGFLGVARKLLDAGARTRVQDQGGKTPLHRALSACKEAAAELLVDADAQIDLRDWDDFVPLHLAAERGYAGVARALLHSGVHPNPMRKGSETALEAALLLSSDGRAEIARLIVAMCALRNIAIDWERATLRRHAQLPIGRLETECGEEIRRMRETWVGGSAVSFHEVATKRAGWLAKRLAHERVRRELQARGLEGRFPHYAGLISRRVEAARRRKHLSDRCLRLLSGWLPLLPLEHILSFCTEREIYNLVLAFTSRT